MWDVTCDVAWRELRQAVEEGEEVDWGDYIPLGDLVPPGDVEEETGLTAGSRVARGLGVVLRRLGSWFHLVIKQRYPYVR
jgi:hypothetical protein